MEDIKFCEDCKWFDIPKTTYPPLCKHHEAKHAGDLVFRAPVVYYYCVTMRVNKCGVAGRLYEAREEASK